MVTRKEWARALLTIATLAAIVGCEVPNLESTDGGYEDEAEQKPATD